MSGNDVEVLIDGEVDNPPPSPVGQRANLGNLYITDDATLENPSSAIVLRENQTHIFTSHETQLILQRQKDSDVVKAKQFDESTPGLLLLRGVYTLMAILMGGFLFVFCIQLILFLFMGLAIESGLTSKQKDFHFGVFFGTLLTIPAFLIGMANAMTIAMAFVADTWNGQKFMKTIIKWDSVLVDWFSCAVFIIIPFLTGGISLSAGSALWWEHTCIAWIICVFAYYLLFAGVTIFFEIDGCLELVHFHTSAPKNSREAMKKAILLKQESMLSGFQTFNYLIGGSDPMNQYTDYEEAQKKHGSEKGTCEAPSISPLSFITVLLARCGFMYEKLQEPKRIYTVDEVRGYTPFVTKNSWGLEKIYCRNRKASLIAIVEGESAMTATQAQSSFICFLCGLVITLFLIIAALTWFDTSPAFIGVACGLYILAIFKQTRNSLALKKIHSKLLNDGKIDAEKNEAVTHVNSSFRITKAKDWFCWSVFGAEVLFFFILPLIALFAAGNNPVGIVFIIVALVTGARRFMSAAVCFEEYGSLDGIEDNNEVNNRSSIDDGSEWREKHRLEMIVSQISHGAKRDFWVNLFAFFIIAFCAIFMSAVAIGSNEGHSAGLSMSPNLLYPGSGNLRYASCQLGRGIVTPAGTTNSLVDFTFLSTAAYNAPSATQESLQTWFNNDTDVASTLIDHQDVVESFKAAYVKDHGESSVTYKFIGFPMQNVGVVSIRGTSNSWDALTDAQLWSSAALSQYIRAVLPLGNLLTPILKYLVKVVSLIESSRLEEISYYKETTAFVEHVKSEGFYGDTVVTGHSLGGGLAMITGAQAKVASVGLSGPNAMISRLTFEPQIEEEDLEKYTFNIVPDRDPVPRIDDLSQNYQRISCKARANAPVDCHFGLRSLCEILYTCGSEGRPIPCNCVHLHKYPVPQLLNGATFDQECPKSD